MKKEETSSFEDNEKMSNNVENMSKNELGNKTKSFKMRRKQKTKRDSTGDYLFLEMEDEKGFTSGEEIDVEEENLNTLEEELLADIENQMEEKKRETISNMKILASTKEEVQIKKDNFIPNGTF